jgi:hypothetical protein
LQCDEWVNNKVLFGCYGNGTQPLIALTDSRIEPELNPSNPPKPERAAEPPVKELGAGDETITFGSLSIVYVANLDLIFFVICFILNFY